MEGDGCRSANPMRNKQLIADFGVLNDSTKEEGAPDSSAWLASTVILPGIRSFWGGARFQLVMVKLVVIVKISLSTVIGSKRDVVLNSRFRDANCKNRRNSWLRDALYPAFRGIIANLT